MTRAGECFVQHHAERVDIGAVADVFLAAGDDLLGRHVLRRPEHHAGHRQPPLVAAAQHRDPEVDDPRDLRAGLVDLDDDVLGLEVAVHEAGGMRVLEPFEQLRDHRDHARACERALRDQIGEVGAARELEHHQLLLRRGLADVDHRDQVLVRQPRRDRCLALEPLHHRRIGEQMIVEHLDRDLATDLDMPCAIHHTHAAGTER